MRISDWSSDVCSSDLDQIAELLQRQLAITSEDAWDQQEIDRDVDPFRQGRCSNDDSDIPAIDNGLQPPGEKARHLAVMHYNTARQQPILDGIRSKIVEDRKSTRLNSSH